MAEQKDKVKAAAKAEEKKTAKKPAPKTAKAEVKPAKVEVKPAKAEAKPTKVEAKPAKVETKPAKVEAKPTKVEAKPAKAETKTTKAEVKPAKVESKPAKVETKPAKAEAKPAKAEVKPAKPAPKAAPEKKTEELPAVAAPDVVYHISKRTEDRKWQVKADGAAKALKLFWTQKEAVDYARTVAGNKEGRIVIHKEDGTEYKPGKSDDAPDMVYHISKRKEDRKWQVKAEGASKTLKLFWTQEEAIDYAKTVAGNKEGRIVIHKEDGSFRKLKY